MHLSQQVTQNTKEDAVLYSLHVCSRQSCPYSILGQNTSLDDAAPHDNAAVAKVITRVSQAKVIEKKMIRTTKSGLGVTV
jgi:hypothetical protein